MQTSAWVAEGVTTSAASALALAQRFAEVREEAQSSPATAVAFSRAAGIRLDDAHALEIRVRATNWAQCRPRSPGANLKILMVTLLGSLL